LITLKIQILHNVLFTWVVMSMGMSQDTQHWREMVALDPGLSPNTAKIKALFDAFPVVTIAIQSCLLGWLFMADILDNPYGYNIEYDENLEEVCSPGELHHHHHFHYKRHLL